MIIHNVKNNQIIKHRYWSHNISLTKAIYSISIIHCILLYSAYSQIPKSVVESNYENNILIDTFSTPPTEKFYTVENQNDKNEEIMYDYMKYDSTQAATPYDNDSSEYIPVSSFVYAGNQRYTVDDSRPRATTKVKYLMLGGVSGLYLGAATALHIYQVNSFWDSTTKFRFIEDGDYALYADKLGHAWATYMNAYIASEGLLASGFSWESATWGGVGVALVYQTYVEIMDGYGKQWGFSPTDMYANFAGAGWFLAQHYVPFLQNFTYKGNYFPPRWFGQNARESSSIFLDDYSGWTFSVAIDVYNLMPCSWKNYWPKWLNVEVGHAVRNLRYREGDPVYTLGLDINPVRLLPDGTNFFNWLIQGLNYIKIPAPTIEFGRETHFRLFYPFQLKIDSVSF